MYMVIADDDIDRRMQFDTARLGAGKIPLVVIVMDMVVLYDREYTAEVSNDTGLTIVVYVAVSNDVRSDRIFAPPIKLCYQSTVPLRLCTVLILVMCPLVVVVLLHIFAERYAAALALRNITVFNYPSF